MKSCTCQAEVRFHHSVDNRKPLKTFELRSNAISIVYSKILQTTMFGIDGRKVSMVKK